MRTPVQTDIPFQRRRAVLADDTEVVTLRVPNSVARVVNAAKPGQVVTALGQAFKTLLRENEPVMEVVKRREDEAKCTDWSLALPPCSGLWELKSRSGHMQRAWFDLSSAMWMGIDWCAPLQHATIMELSRGWRGLKEPPAEGYTYRVPGQRVRLLEG